MLIPLLISFMVIGLGAYGGGLVTIPLIQHELVVSRQWLGFDEMGQMLAIAQMTPGPIAVNAATFTGFRLGGMPGAGLATVSVVLPGILILALIVPWIEKFNKNETLKKFGRGVQLGVLSLIVFAVWSYGSAAIQGWSDLVIAVGAFLILVVFQGKIHPVLVIFAGGLLGLIL